MMEYPRQEDLNSSNCTERSIKTNYHEFHNYLISNYSECEKWSEKLYWFYNDLKERPKCPICGNVTKFQNFKRGYREFCSNKCLGKSTDIKSRRKQSVLKKYGVDNVFKNTTVKNKQKKTVLERYGVDNVFKSDVIKEKIKITNIEKLGVEYPMQSQIVRDKSKQTCTDKYGVEHNTSCTTIKDKIKNTCQERYDGIGFQSPIIRDKSKQTIRNKYNVDNYTGFKDRADFDKFMDDLFEIFDKSNAKIFGIVIREDLIGKHTNFKESYLLTNNTPNHLCKSNHKYNEYLYVWKKE